MKSLGFWKLLVSSLICSLTSKQVSSMVNKEGRAGEAAKLKDMSKILEVCPTRNKERLLRLMQRLSDSDL